MTSTITENTRDTSAKLFHVRAVLFDFDGTLIPSEWLYFQALVNELNTKGVAADLYEVRKHVVGHTTTKSHALLSNAFPTAIDDHFFTRVVENYLQALRDHGWHRGVTVLCSDLNTSRIYQAIVTNSTLEELSLNLQHLAANPHLQAFFTYGNGHKPKPAPDLYQAAAEHFGITPSDCLAVEDSVTGATAALEAGMTVTIYDPDRTFPINELKAKYDANRIYLVRNFNEIACLLGVPQHSICSHESAIPLSHFSG